MSTTAGPGLVGAAVLNARYENRYYLMSNTLAVIPARGGSQGLKRKNLLPDANGVPLVLASARAARDAGCEVWVSTDDAEIASLAAIDGHHIQHRGP